MTIEISTLQHREMLHRRMFLVDDCWSPQCRAPHDSKSVGLEECRIGSVKHWKNVRLEGCRIGKCDFMDYIRYIIFGIFLTYFDSRYNNL